MMYRKFHNKPIDNVDGHFDSTNEWRRYVVLKDAERSGKISNLQRQVTYTLIPKQEKDVIVHLKTKDKIEKRMVTQKITYTADFVYEKDGALVVEDFKGQPNDRWPLKKAMMYYFHGIEVREVKKPTESV